MWLFLVTIIAILCVFIVAARWNPVREYFRDLGPFTAALVALALGSYRIWLDWVNKPKLVVAFDSTNNTCLEIKTSDGNVVESAIVRMLVTNQGRASVQCTARLEKIEYPEEYEKLETDEGIQLQWTKKANQASAILHPRSDIPDVVQVLTIRRFAAEYASQIGHSSQLEITEEPSPRKMEDGIHKFHVALYPLNESPTRTEIIVENYPTTDKFMVGFRKL